MGGLKKMTAQAVNAKFRVGRTMILVGAVLFGFGIFLELFLNLDRYGGMGVESVSVAAKVTGSAPVYSEEVSDGAEIVQERHYLTAEFQYEGQTHAVTLSDYFTDKSYVKQHMGEIREVHVDAATFEVLDERPFNPWFLLPLVSGFGLATAGILLRFRYTDYRSRLVPIKPRRRRRAVSSGFQMQRGNKVVG